MGGDDEDVISKRQKLREQIKANIVAAAAAGVDLEGKDIFGRLFVMENPFMIMTIYVLNLYYQTLLTEDFIFENCGIMAEDFIFELAETGSDDDEATEMSEDDFFLAGSDDNADADDEWTDKTSRHDFCIYIPKVVYGNPELERN